MATTSIYLVPEPTWEGDLTEVDKFSRSMKVRKESQRVICIKAPEVQQDILGVRIDKTSSNLVESNKIKG